MRIRRAGAGQRGNKFDRAFKRCRKECLMIAILQPPGAFEAKVVARGRRAASQAVAPDSRLARRQYAVHTKTVQRRLTFSWDPAKARKNVQKHRVSFEEAQTAFLDESARLIDDPDHSGREDRFILLGVSAALRVLVVVHVYRDADSVIHIISARRATPHERLAYEGPETRP